MTRRIGVFTSTRADYGLLYWLLQDIQAASDLELELLVTGTHLSSEFGRTVDDIEGDGIEIRHRVEMLISGDSPAATAKSLGIAVLGFTEVLAPDPPDALVVLGDRYEALAAAQTAAILRIPVVHLHGGEITEGAYDDAFRHAISKLASLHCVAAERYRERVVQLGEHPSTVHVVGALGLDHLRRAPDLPMVQLAESTGWPLRKPYFLVTYHPATLAVETEAETFDALLSVLDDYPGHQVIITFPNADDGNVSIRKSIAEYAASDSTRVLVATSLGSARYLAALRNAELVIGNSSSGIIEAPSVSTVTIDIGARQRGRLAADSVLRCASDRASIADAVRRGLALADNPRDGMFENPYDRGNASGRVVELLRATAFDAPKTFFDLAGDGTW